MRARLLQSFVFVLMAGAAIAGCSSGSGGVNIPTAAVPTPLPTAGGNATLQLGVAVQSTTSRVKGADVYVAPRSAPANRVLVGAFDITAGSSRCVAQSNGSRQCTLTMPVPSGSQMVYVEHWDTVVPNTSAIGRRITASSPPRPGTRLGTASFFTAISPNATATMGVTTDATPASLTMQVTPTSIPQPGATILVSVAALDGNGNAIARDFSVALFAPPNSVTPLGTAPPTATPIFAPDGSEVLTAGTAVYTYNGGAVNPITAIAIAGTFSEVAQIAPAATVACANPGSLMYNNPQPNTPGIGSQLFHVKVGVGGSTALSSEVDTGSTGVQFPVKNFPTNMSQIVGPGRAFSIPLQPSGNVESGNVYLARVALQDTNGNPIGTTIPMQIEGLTQVCVGTNCSTTNLFPYVGIGFARESDSTTWPSLPVNNPAMQLTDIVTANASNAMHPGYILTKSAMTLGITSANSAPYAARGYSQLTPSTTFTADWNGAQGCVAFNGSTSYSCGTMLLDIGQADMFITNFAYPDPKTIQSISIAAPTGTNPTMSYTFPYTPGTPGVAPAPVNVMFLQLGGAQFINLGTHAIAATNYLYDAACGRVGYTPAGT